MGKSDRILPPGPNPREDLLKEKDDRKLRDYLRQQAAERGERESTEEESKRQEEGEQR